LVSLLNFNNLWGALDSKSDGLYGHFISNVINAVGGTQTYSIKIGAFVGNSAPLYS